MLVQCPQCDEVYDDETCSVLCPHTRPDPDLAKVVGITSRRSPFDRVRWWLNENLGLWLFVTSMAVVDSVEDLQAWVTTAAARFVSCVTGRCFIR